MFNSNVLEICLIILLNIKLYFSFGILYLIWIICHLIILVD